MSFEIMLKPCIKTDKKTIFEDDWVRFYNMIHLREARRAAEIGNDYVTIIPKDNGKEDLEKAIWYLNKLIEYKGD
jgi:hypothetical protein